MGKSMLPIRPLEIPHLAQRPYQHLHRPVGMWTTWAGKCGLVTPASLIVTLRPPIAICHCSSLDSAAASFVFTENCGMRWTIFLAKIKMI